MKKQIEIVAVEEINFKETYTLKTAEGTQQVTRKELEKIILHSDNEITFDTEFENDDFGTLEMALNNLDLEYAEIAPEQGEYDLYVHKVTAEDGEITVDFEGQFIQTFKTEQAAINKANKLGKKVK